MKNRENPVYLEAAGKAIDALEIAGREFERARQARKSKPVGRDLAELRREEQEWRDLWERLRDLSAGLFADMNKEREGK